MRKTLVHSLSVAAFVVFATTAGAQVQAATSVGSAPTPPAPTMAAPEVGQAAPDFTLGWADSAGVRAAPVKLSELRGKVVVLAFYPADRTQGCTIEMTKFKAEYEKIFGKDVVVLPISGDSLGSHHSWAKDAQFPFALVSDPGLKVADQYGSHITGRSAASRTVFVIGKDGKIAFRNLRFNANAEVGYTDLAAEIAKAR